MKLLLDECLPKRLKNDLSEHDVLTVDEADLKGLKNGELLRTAVARKFEAIITVDRGMQFQQNLPHLELALVVLIATPCRYPQLKRLVPRVLQALENIKRGEAKVLG